MTQSANIHNQFKTGGHANNTGQVVIQCPSCSTKFSVNGASFAGIDDPRFHCSRCDNVFEVEPELLELPKETKIHLVDEVSPALNCNPVRHGEEEEEEFETIDREADEKIVAEEDTISDGIFQDAETSEPDFPDPVTINELDHTAAPVTPIDVSQPLRSRQPEQLSFDFESRDLNSRHLGEPTPAGRPRTGAGVALSQIQMMMAAEEPFEDLRAIRSRDMSPWSSFCVLLAPLALLITAIVATNAYISSTTSPADLPKFLQVSADLVPPSGLRIVESNFRRITLSGGDTIALVNGTIANDEMTDFDTVKLEAMAFDSQGHVIGSTKASLGSSLSQARLRSLSPKMIAELQQMAPAKTAPMKPTERRQFTIVFLGDDITNARYFAARVFSAH